MRMTDPQYKPGDVVNGHRLTQQPDGSLAWLPVGAEPQHKTEAEPQHESGAEPQHRPGDVVNGHRLTEQGDGSLAWLPVSAELKPGKSRRGLWITLGAIGGVLLLIIIIGSLNRGSGVKDTAAEQAAPTSEASAEPEPEPVMVTIPSLVVGMTADTAVSTLRSMGLDVTYDGEPDAEVTGITPAVGTEVEEGSTVTLTVVEKPKLTLAQENALKQAQQYLDFMPFSRQGLIDQMTSQYGSGYPVDVATWAVDYLNPDWNAEAAEAAKSYLDTMSFSRDALYEQLTSEYGSQFTPEQANAGLAAVGY